MPRRSRSSRRRRQKQQPALRWLRQWRIIALVLAMVAGALYLPPSVTQHLPDEVQPFIAWSADARRLIDQARDGVFDWPAIARLGQQLSDQWLLWTTAESTPANLPQTPGSFAAARRLLYDRVYFDRRETFYCGCRYDAQRVVALQSCALTDLADQARALRVEVEHVFPASRFGQFRRCWQQPERFAACRTSDGGTLAGRACCERADPVFAAAHNDLHNLFPAVGYINGRRSNYNWGPVRQGQQYGGCAIRINSSMRRAQPPDAVRGDIARTMLYMRDTYEIPLSGKDQRMYAEWNNADPPDAWERLRNARIRALQGRGNGYIEHWSESWMTNDPPASRITK